MSYYDYEEGEIGMYKKVKLAVSDKFIEKATKKMVEKNDVLEEMKTIGIDSSDVEKIIRLEFGSCGILTVTYKE